MTDTPAVLSDAERFGWLERRNDDFPYYRGRPMEISPGGWWLVMLGVALGFAVLILGPTVLKGPVWPFVFSILYFAIPLAALAIVAGRWWTAIFRPLRGMDFLLMVAFAILNIVIVVTLAVGSIMINVTETTAWQARSSSPSLR